MGRFYIGPVCGGAKFAGGYGIRPYGPREKPAANRKANPIAPPVGAHIVRPGTLWRGKHPRVG